MTHVLHVTTVPKSLRFIQGQVEFMRARGVKLTCLTSPGPEIKDFTAQTGVPVHTLEMPRRISPLADLRTLALMTRTIRAISPDIVHAHTPKGGLLGMLAATLAGCPARIYHMRGLPLMTATGARRALLTATERVSCACAHHTLCVSHSLRDVALNLGLTDPTHIHVMAGGSGQGVDALGRFDPASLAVNTRQRMREALGIPLEAIVIGFIGRMVRDKGIVELVSAWQGVLAAHPNVHLVCVGDFEPQDPVPDDVRRTLEQSPRTHLVGWREDTPDYYAAMDMVTLPTYREGFPNVPLEAAAMQLPVVATRIPGCIDAVEEGRTGLLVNVRDARALQNALERYIEDATLRHAHGLAGRERIVSEFLPEQVFAGIYEMYQRVLSR